MNGICDGNAGSGKTALLTWIGLTSNVETYANFDISIPHFDIDIEKLFENNDIPRLFLIDEAQSFVDSRKSMSAFNILYSYANAQRRKTNTVIFMSVPDFFMLENRVRESCDIYINAQRIDNRFIYSVNNLRNGSSFEIFADIEKMQPIFDSYKTHAVVINANELIEIQKNSMSINPIRLNEQTKKGVTEVLNYAKIRNLKKVTHAIVKYVCQKKEIILTEDCENSIYVEVNDSLEMEQIEA